MQTSFLSAVYFALSQITSILAMASDREVLVEENEEKVIKKLCNLIEKKAEESISESGLFKIGLSGIKLRGLSFIQVDLRLYVQTDSDNLYTKM